MSESWDPISDTQWDGNSSLRTARTETFRDTYPSGSFCRSEGSAHQIAAAFAWLLPIPAAGGLSGDTWPGLRQPELSGEIGEVAYEFWQDQSHAHDFLSAVGSWSRSQAVRSCLARERRFCIILLRPMLVELPLLALAFRLAQVGEEGGI